MAGRTKVIVFQIGGNLIAFKGFFDCLVTPQASIICKTTAQHHQQCQSNCACQKAANNSVAVIIKYLAHFIFSIINAGQICGVDVLNSSLSKNLRKFVCIQL